MNAPVVKKTLALSAWFFLAIGVVTALILVVAAINERNIGHGIAGIGMALIGVALYLAPIDIRGSIFEQLRNRPIPTSQVTVLGVIGGALLVIGLVLRWVI